jgi:ppGpp synthetase/RelA/SpoT-type nucleotidyltranferase
MAKVELSKSQVRNAGRTLRRYMRSEDISDDELERAITVIQQYRAAHQIPLTKANNGLRSMVRTEGCQVEVSQRLKRFRTILDKLVRLPNLPLSTMQDIGGVRAVLNSIDEVRRVEARLKHNRPVVGYSDYISNPRRSGYRGVHVVVEYDSRQIEVQLRTRVMHDWAIAVERLSSRVGENLKGDGDHAVQGFLAAASRAMALEELGGIVDSSTITEMDRLRAIADPYLRGGS